MSTVDTQRRVLSGMRPLGRLHLGHYQALKVWAGLQHEYECFFCIADWHVLSDDAAQAGPISQHVLDMAVDWLSAGISPSSATIFVQSQVPEHAELHLLLSMLCPLSWLERLPACKGQQRVSYGLLGYPLLQAAGILLYRAGQVPVASDQLAHVEFTREIARRFNHLYREPGFESKAEAAIARLGRKTAKLYNRLRKAYQEQGDMQALETAQALLREQSNILLSDQERLLGYLEGGGRVVLPEPQSILFGAPRIPGLDGDRMSREGDNAIFLCDSAARIEEKLKRMPTDPRRVRREDRGDPACCPVGSLHQVYSTAEDCQQLGKGCRNAEIGCLDCKQALARAVIQELTPIRQRALEYEQDPDLVRSILVEGAERARDEARETLVEVRRVMGLNYR